MKCLRVLALLALFALAGSAQAQWAIFQASSTSSGNAGNGGGPNLRAANIYGVPNSVQPSSYYTPGIATEAVSTADFLGTDGYYWPRPYDLNAMGPEGQAIAAVRGRYFWPMTPDHPTGSLGNWLDGQDFKTGGFSSDPAKMPRSINQQAMPPCGRGNNVGTNPYSTNPICGYHLAFINYAPEDTGNVFHWYNESQDNATSPASGFTKTATTTNTSPIVTGISGGTSLLAGGIGNPVTGTGIPASTTILLVGRQLTGTITNSSAIVTGISSTTGINGGGCGGGGDTIYGVTQAPLPGTQVCVLTVDGPNQVTMTVTALSTSAAGIIIDNGSTVTLDKNATASGSTTLTFKTSNAMQHFAGLIRSNDLVTWTQYGPVTKNYGFTDFTSYQRPTRVSAGVWTSYSNTNYRAERRVDGPPGDSGTDPNGQRSLSGVSTSTDGLTFDRPSPRPVPATIPTAYKIGTRIFQFSAYDPVTISAQVWVPVVEDGRNVIISNANPAVVTKNAHGYSANDPITSFATGGTGHTITGDITSGSAIVTNIVRNAPGTVTQTQDMQAGMSIGSPGRGLVADFPGTLPYPGFAAGTTVQSVDSGTQITLSQNATATLTQTPMYVATLPPPIVPNTTYYVKTVLSADTFTISATPGGTAISTAGASQCFVSLIQGTCIFIPDGGMYVARVAVDASMNVLASPAPVRISSVYSGIYPGPTFLQTVNSYLEDGVMFYFPLRGFFTSSNNFGFNLGGTYNSGYGALQQQLVDVYCEVVDATAAAQAAPSGTTISAASGVVSLSWYDCLPNQTYRVYRGNAAAQTTLIGDVTGLTMTDSSAPRDQVVTYKIVTLQTGTERQSRTLSTFVSSSSAFVNAHITRALADGADYATCNRAALDARYDWMVSQSLVNTLINWVNPNFCVAKNASGVITKIYDLGTTRLPKYNDLWFCSATPCTGASLTTYDPLGLNGTAAAWVNGASNAFGVFGGLLDANNRNNRLNHIRRNIEFTVFSSYAKAASGTNISLFGLGESTGSISLRHLAGTPGSAAFLLSDNTVSRTATANFTGTATAPHTIGGTFGSSGLFAFADGVAGSAASAGLNLNSDLSAATVLKGALGDLPTVPFAVVGSPTSRFTYDATTSTYGQLGSEASFSGGDLVLFSKELTPTQMASLHTLVSQEVSPTPSITYDIIANFSAVCDGSNNDAPAFATFNSTAKTYQSTHPGQLIKLTIPAGKTCVFKSGGSGTAFGAGLKNFWLEMNGSTINDNAGAGNGFFLGGASGVVQDNAHSARFNTANAGSTMITLVSSGLTSLFNVGDKALVTGVDRQGEGYPPNPAFLEYVTITAKGTGTLTFTPPLSRQYKSTWPAYNTGTAFEADQGGPATIYALNQDWDTQQVYSNGTFSQVGQTYSVGRDITFKNVIFTGTACGVPTQNQSYRLIKATMTNCAIEVDKLNGYVLYQNISAISLIDFQSASANTFVLDGSTVTTLNGGGVSSFITDSTIGSMQAGAHSFGASTGPLNIAGTSIGALTNGGASQDNINLRGSWASGQLTIPHNFTITGSADNGSGLLRVAVDSTAGYSTGYVTNFVSSRMQKVCVNSATTVTVIDATHFDLQGSTSSANNVTISIASPAVITLAGHGFVADQRVVFGTTSALPTGLTAGTTYFIIAAGLGANTFEVSATQGGAAINTTGSQSGTQFLQCVGSGGSLPLGWATPGENIYFSSRDVTQGPMAQVTDMTQNASSTFVQTTLPGGFPMMATSGSPATASVKVHPAPQFTCTACTGAAWAVALNNAAPGIPLGSYLRQTYTGATTPFQTPVWGQMVSTKITVGTVYAGASSINFNIGGPFIDFLNSATRSAYAPTINPKIAGERDIFPTTTSGSQSGDSFAAPGTGAWFIADQITPGFSSIPGDIGSTSVTIEITTNQGVVNPRRRPANDNARIAYRRRRRAA